MKLALLIFHGFYLALRHDKNAVDSCIGWQANGRLDPISRILPLALRIWSIRIASARTKERTFLRVPGGLYEKYECAMMLADEMLATWHATHSWKSRQ